MARICRTCLVVIEDSLYYAIDAIDSTSEPVTRQEKILFCVPEMVIDVLESHVICQSCYDALRLAYEFRQRCLETEKTVNDYLINNSSQAKKKYIDLEDVVRHTTQNSSEQEANAAVKRIVLEEIDVIIKYAQDGAEFGAVFSHFMAEVDNDNKFKEKLPSDDVDSLLSRIPECTVEVKRSDKDMDDNENNIFHSFDDKEKIWRCDICGRGFKAKDKLTRHARIHTGEKPYKCSECVKSFSRKDKLCLHQRTHTGEKPFICEICDKMFSRKDKLRTHMRTHKMLDDCNYESPCI